MVPRLSSPATLAAAGLLIVGCSSSSASSGPADAQAALADSRADGPANGSSDAATDSGAESGVPTTGSGSMMGTVSGQTLTVADGTFDVEPGTSPPILVITLSSAAGLCRDVQHLPPDGVLASTTLLELDLVSMGTTFAPGTWMLQTGSLASVAYFTAVGPTCNFMVGPNYLNTSGSVTLTSVQPNMVGTFDLTFGSDHVTGSFDVGSCTFTPVGYDGGVNCVMP